MKRSTGQLDSLPFTSSHSTDRQAILRAWYTFLSLSNVPLLPAARVATPPSCPSGSVKLIISIQFISLSQCWHAWIGLRTSWYNAPNRPLHLDHGLPLPSLFGSRLECIPSHRCTQSSSSLQLLYALAYRFAHIAFSSAGSRAVG